MKKVLKWPIKAVKAIGYFFMTVFVVFGMWIVDVATHRSPDDNTG